MSIDKKVSGSRKEIIEKELENLRKRVEELEKANKGLGEVINLTNQIYMKLFNSVMVNLERILSVLEKLPTKIAKKALEQMKFELSDTVEMLEKARENPFSV